MSAQDTDYLAAGAAEVARQVEETRRAVAVLSGALAPVMGRVDRMEGAAVEAERAGMH